jgi:hypothetical protein
MIRFYLLLVIMTSQNFTLFDFSKDSSLKRWQIVDDVVMGGRSDGSFQINNNGHGEFSGKVSLENNGGFSSLRYNFETVNSSNYANFQIRLKGDGKAYQFLVKDSRYNRYSYIYTFQTSGKWETITIPFNSMYPSFRGNRLRGGNFDGSQMEEIAFLIGNKKAEQFTLEIDKIYLN